MTLSFKHFISCRNLDLRLLSVSTTYERRDVCFLISDHNRRILTQISKFQIDKRNKLKNKRKLYRRIIRLFVLLGLNCIVRRTIHVKCVWVFFMLLSAL
jgi:hypothetical protein